MSECSSSPSSSTSRHNSPLSPNPRGIIMAMEDVWKDINLSSLYDHRFNHDPNLQGMGLHDFLGRPFAKDTPPRPAPSPATPPPPQATTRLNLNSVPEFHFCGTVQNSGLQPPRGPVSPKASFEGLASSPAGSNGSGRKRAHNSGNSSGDHRHKRMIKNRESAARSRARKQESYSLYSHS